MLDFNKPNLVNTPTNSNSGAKGDRPKAQIWLNVGYSVEATNSETNETETKFISLPVGIPIDTAEHVKVSGNNADFRALRSAQNSLLDQILEAGKALKPGEERLLNLQIQLRHVKDEAAPIADDDNKYAVQLSL